MAFNLHCEFELDAVFILILCKESWTLDTGYITFWRMEKTQMVSVWARSPCLFPAVLILQVETAHSGLSDLPLDPELGKSFPKSSKHLFFHISKQMWFKMHLSNRASWVWHWRHPSWRWPETCSCVKSMYFSFRMEEYVLKSLEARLLNPKVVNLMNCVRPDEGRLCLMEDLKYWHVKYCCSFLYILLCLEWPYKDGYQWINK